MLPIVRYPSFVEDFLPRLNGVFTKPQLKHYSRFLIIAEQFDHVPRTKEVTAVLEKQKSWDLRF